MTTKEKRLQAKQNNFGEGPVWKCIVVQAIPLTVAQLVALLYNVVDRIYLGHLGDGNSMALTGVGLTFPIITLIMAFTALFGNGGVPLFAMARGRGKPDEAEKIMGNSFGLLAASSLVLMAVCFIFCKPIMFLFGASEASYVYAEEYLRIYLIGTTFAMVATGMNGFINAQGFPRIGMFTTIIGALMNIALDPIFIFVLDMGVAGAALATVISQAVSAIWVMYYLVSGKTPIRLRRMSVHLDKAITIRIFKLGSANFIVHGSNCLVQVVCNVMLQGFGGDLYVGIMTVLNSIREITVLPINGLVNGGQPVISFNYGAGNDERVKAGIRFNSLLGIIYTMIAWLSILLFPMFWFRIFTDDLQMAEMGAEALHVYFFGFIFMALQFAGQSTFQAVGDARHSIFFSTLRKVIIVVPLTILLPKAGLGVMGVFMAEPISNVIGGTACYSTMWRTVYKRLGKEDR